MNNLISLFHQTPSLIHNAHIYLPEAHSQSQIELTNKGRVDIGEMAIRSGFSSDIVKYKPYEMKGRVAVIEVKGVLLHDYNWSSSYATGYQVIQRKLKAALEDPDVKGIYMPFHTPGGSVFGCPDTAALMQAVGKVKPIWTLAVDAALSAGQWLAAQGTRRLGTQSSMQGSVGVVIPNVNYAKYLEENSITVDYIFSGEHKVDGDPYIEMKPEVREKFQARVDILRNEFATAVASGTGMTLEAVLDTEAQIYRAEESVEIGLIEEIASPHYIEDEFNEHLASAGTTIILGEQSAMSDPNKNEQNVDAAKIAADAKTEERTRVTGILTLEEAVGREKQAGELAKVPGLSVEAAKSILSAGAATSPEQPEEVDPAAQALAAIKAEHGAALETGGDEEQASTSGKKTNSLAKAYRG